jgi:predicted Zn-dependent protease with MMP-like domain
MDRRSFEAAAEEALRQLPDEFRSRLDNVTVLVEDEPSPDLLRSMGLPRRETLLGVYQGTPYPERGVTTYGNVLPDRIVLFQRPIESMGGGPAAIRRRIAETVVHEIGHYFGLSDDEMDDAEEELDARFGGAPGNGEPRAAQRRDDDLDDEDDLEEDEDLDDEDDLEDEQDDEDLDEDDDLDDEDDLDEDEDPDDEDLEDEDDDDDEDGDR